jgi:aminopeptidase-like protein
MTDLLKRFREKDLGVTGRELYGLAEKLYPICRSITGNGVRETLRTIQEIVPCEIVEVPSGTPVFDWNVPKEWNIRDAYIADSEGSRVVDFQRSNLHVLNYSIPVDAILPLAELKDHLFSLPDHPDWIPYRTSYYKEQWGFCLSHRQFEALREGTYKVRIDSTLRDGTLSYGEYFLPGNLKEEILISTHICHPSLANDNLSGLAVAAYLARFLTGKDLRYSYRFLFVPGTIGAITWLARNRQKALDIRHGLVLTGLGDRGGFHYKKSRRGNAEIDKAMAHVLRHCGETSEVLEFSPYGYDERQYCSPGFNLPVGCLMRSVWGTFPEYHTSADNLDFIHCEQLARSLRLCVAVCDVLENNRVYLNENPCCEPQLGKRNLYRSTGGASLESEINARLWVLNLSDGEHALLDIADRAGLSFDAVCNAADVLRDSHLLTELESSHSLGACLKQDGHESTINRS